MLSFFVFIFFYRTISNIKETIKTSQEKWQIQNTKRENAKSLINLIKVIEPERTLLETHFVRSSDVVPFLNTIEKLTKKVGVSSEIVSVTIPKDNSSLMLEIKTLGSFEAIYKLILLLENSPYNLLFVSADIINPNTQNIVNIKTIKTPKWTASFQLKLLDFIN